MCSWSTFKLGSYFVARDRKFASSCYVRDDLVSSHSHQGLYSQICKSKTKGSLEIQVPPSDMEEQFGRLFLKEEAADVIFNVRGETFPTHKIMITTPSPVFKAQLLNEAKVHCVAVEDMQPAVFKALLNFIYTDVLRDFGADLNDEGYSKTIMHLLVAADRYSMDRLKLLCGSILAKDLCVETVATTLVLAYQHNCESLKDVCIEFMDSSDIWMLLWQLKVMKMPKELALLS